MRLSYLFDDPRNYKCVVTGEISHYYAKCDNQWIEVDKSVFEALLQPILDQQKYDDYSRRKGLVSYEYLMEKENKGLLSKVINQKALQVESAETILVNKENQLSINALLECQKRCVQALSSDEQKMLAKLCNPATTQRRVSQEYGEKDYVVSRIKSRLFQNLKHELEQLPFDFDNLDIP